jgi:sugar diacid utilization regulator
MDGAAALLSAVAKAKGIYSIVSVGYELLGNPVIVSDKSWKAIVIATDEKESEDKGFNEFLTQGSLSLDTVSVDIKDKLTNRIEQSDKPFRYQGEHMKYARLFGRVLVGSRPVATVSVLELSRPFTKEDYETVELLCNAISAEMQKNKFLHYTRGLLYEELIVELIEGRDSGASPITERAKALGVGMKKYIYILTIDIKGFDIEKFSLSYMRDYLEKMISGCKALIYGDHIVIVTSCTKENGLLDTDLTVLRTFLGEYNMRGGVSRGFLRLEDLGEHYRQSLEALVIGARMDTDSHLHMYDDYAVYHIAKACSQVADLRVFCQPKLDTLMEYDKEHNTSFTSSLYAYLRHSRNITETAKALHLHRNSMIYHLKRIEEILGFSLTESNTLLHIELSFRFMEYDKLLFLEKKKSNKQQ